MNFDGTALILYWPSRSKSCSSPLLILLKRSATTTGFLYCYSNCCLSRTGRAAWIDYEQPFRQLMCLIRVFQGRLVIPWHAFGWWRPCPSNGALGIRNTFGRTKWCFHWTCKWTSSIGIVVCVFSRDHAFDGMEKLYLHPKSECHIALGRNSFPFLRYLLTDTQKQNRRGEDSFLPVEAYVGEQVVFAELPLDVPSTITPSSELLSNIC